jgi:hypothetical protein
MLHVRSPLGGSFAPGFHWKTVQLKVDFRASVIFVRQLSAPNSDQVSVI